MALVCPGVIYMNCAEGLTEIVHKHSGWLEMSGLSQSANSDHPEDVFRPIIRVY